MQRTCTKTETRSAAWDDARSEETGTICPGLLAVVLLIFLLPIWERALHPCGQRLRRERAVQACVPLDHRYKTTSRAIRASQNTVRKYVAALEEKGLTATQLTDIRTKDGRKRNGSLLCTIHPIKEAIDIFNARQFARADTEAEKQRIATKLAPVGLCVPLCALLYIGKVQRNKKPAIVTNYLCLCY